MYAVRHRIRDTRDSEIRATGQQFEREIAKVDYTFQYMKFLDIEIPSEELSNPEEKNSYLWLPNTVENQVYNPSDMPRLRRQGWKSSKIMIAHLYVLTSQYSIMRGVIDPGRDIYDEQGKLNQITIGWFHKDDIAFAEKYPVIFPILTRRDAPPVPGYNEQFGAIGICIHDKPQAFLIHQLSSEAQELFDRMHRCVDALTATTPINQGTVLSEVHHMAQELAKAYYEHYNQESQRDITTKQQRNIPPSISDIFVTGAALMPTNQVFQDVLGSIHNAASGAGRWQFPPNSPPFYSHTTKSGSTIIEIMHDDKEILDDHATESLWAQVREFTDLDGDTALCMIAQLIKGPMDDSRSTWFFSSNMLDYRGIQPIMKADTPGGKKRRAGHRQEDLQDIADSVSRVSNMWLTIERFIHEEAPRSKRGKGKRREYTHKGRFIPIDEVWYQQELPSGDSPIERHLAPRMAIGWRIRAGEWLNTFLSKQNRYVAYLCQQALKYDPHNEKWEKRLARYFFFHIRMNAASGGVFNREIGKMIDELSLPVEEDRPQRTKDRFEKAMNRLVQDEQINGWEYVEKIEYKARGWIKTWLQSRIAVYVASPIKPIQEASEHM